MNYMYSVHSSGYQMGVKCQYRVLKSATRHNIPSNKNCIPRYLCLKLWFKVNLKLLRYFIFFRIAPDFRCRNNFTNPLILRRVIPIVC